MISLTKKSSKFNVNINYKGHDVWNTGLKEPPEICSNKFTSVGSSVPRKVCTEKVFANFQNN